MHISLDQIKEYLYESGHKDSRVKTLVLEIIYQSPNLLSVPELLSILKSKEVKANKTSIYRIIALLLSKDIIYEIDLLDGKKRYGIKQGADYPRLICIKCGKIISMRSEQIVNYMFEKILQEYSFEIKKTNTQIFGQCKNCLIQNYKHY